MSMCVQDKTGLTIMSALREVIDVLLGAILLLGGLVLGVHGV
jgi:hypothetical protein